MKIFLATNYTNLTNFLTTPHLRWGSHSPLTTRHCGVFRRRGVLRRRSLFPKER